MFQHSRSIIRYPRECRDPHSRLLPTAGVCEQRLGAFLRLLLTAGEGDPRYGGTFLRLWPTAGVGSPRFDRISLRLLLTAGVCEQCLGAFLRLLLTAGVCDRRVGATNKLLPTAGVCDHRVGVSPRLLPTTGVCDRCVCATNTFAHRRCMRPAFSKHNY